MDGMFMNLNSTAQNVFRVTSLSLATLLPLGAQADTGRQLADLLASKGIISAAEAASLSGTTPSGLVELLVAKGVISSDEAASLAPADPAPAPAPDIPAGRPAYAVRAKEKAVQALTIQGRLQAQWDHLSTSYDTAADPRNENQLFLRRVQLGATAQLTGDVSGTFVAEFGNGAAGGGEVEKAVVDWQLSDFHRLTVGYQKAPFVQEETTSAARIPTVERAISTRYFTEQLPLGNRYTGLFLAGAYPSGITFTLAATSADQGNVSGSSSSDHLALWAGLGWSGDLPAGKLDMGLSLAHSPGGRLRNQDDMGWNLYANYRNGPFTLLAELIGARLENARPDQSHARPLAFTLTPIWKIDDRWELVARQARLDADGGIGADISTTFRGAPENGSALYDSVDTTYLGGNYYFRGNALKLSAGYEWARYNDNLTGQQGDANVDGFRTRLQLLF